MTNMQYVGARYVPIVYTNPDDGSANWKAGVEYEALTVVVYNGDSYTSKKAVPVGVGNPADNSLYWVKTGDFNASLLALQNRVNRIDNTVGSETLETEANNVTGAINELYNGGVKDGSIELDKLSDEAIEKLKNNNLVIFMPNAVVSGSNAYNGASTLFITANEHKTVMFDSGRETSYTDIKNEMLKNGVAHLDYFILSHYHNDHYENIDNLKNDGFITNSTIVYLPRNTTAVPGWDVIQADVRAKFVGNTVITVDSAAPLTVEDITFNFFNCDADTFSYYESQSYDDGNDYSICAYVHCGEFVMMLTGDLGVHAMLYQLEQGNIEHCDVLQIPHHGGYRGEAENFAYRIMPTYGIVQVNALPESTHDTYNTGSAFNISNMIQMFNTIDVPCYSTAYGALYMSIDEYGYCLLSNGKNVLSYTSLNHTFPVYVDSSYVGVSYGTKFEPFSSIKQALMFINSLKHTSRVNIQFLTPYNYPTETVEFDVGDKFVGIIGTKSGDDYNVNLGNVYVESGNCYLENIHLAIASTTAAVVCYRNVFCKLSGCLIDGNTLSISSSHQGSAISSIGGSFVALDDVTIKNRNSVVYLEEGGRATFVDCNGSDNKYLVVGWNGDYAAFLRSEIGYTAEMIRRRNNSYPSVNFVKTDNKNFSAFAPFEGITFAGSDTDVTDTFDMSGYENRSRIIRVYAQNGAIYQCTKMTSNISTPTLVQNAVSADDPNLAVTASGATLTVVHSGMVKVIVI